MTIFAHNEDVSSGSKEATMTNLRVMNFDELPNSALVSIKELIALSGRSRTSLWRDVCAGNLAQPMKFGSRNVKWTAKEIRRYLNGTL